MRLVILIPLLFICNLVSAQKLTKNERDKYTKIHMKETSYEKIWRDAMYGGLIEVAAKNAGDQIQLWFKMHESIVFSISEGDIMYLLLDNDKSVKITCINGDVAYPTKTMWHATIGYVVTEEQSKELSSANLVGLRIDRGSNEYITKEIKSKYATKVKDVLSLVTNIN